MGIDKELYMGIKRSNPQKGNRNTHVNEKMFRKLRGMKTLRIELPDDVERREQDKMTADELRVSLLKKNINPYKEVAPREWNEHQLTLQSFYAVVDPYAAPEEMSFQVNQIKEDMKNKYYNYFQGVRRIKKKVGFETFSAKTFGATAEDVYVSAFKALTQRNKKLLHNYVTEHAFVKLWPDVENGTVVWELVRFVEPSRVIAVRCADSPPKSGNDIAQVTVRMHSEQKLAIYDRFGHLLLGSETEVKSCVEYVVFENHIASVDGKWRFHDKVYPHWLKPKQSILRTDLLDTDRPVLEPVPLKVEHGVKMKEKNEKMAEKQRLEGRSVE
uniref:Large ribosomal subunit protein mL45 n=1 Tax=Ditylenchus dipsaci TaxID=166011 RepID=A0A915DVK0_9BILA